MPSFSLIVSVSAFTSFKPGILSCNLSNNTKIGTVDVANA